MISTIQRTTSLYNSIKKETYSGNSTHLSGYMTKERLLEKKIEGQILCTLKSVGVL